VSEGVETGLLAGMTDGSRAAATVVLLVPRRASALQLLVTAILRMVAREIVGKEVVLHRCLVSCVSDSRYA
jgi:hypothetical protein